MERNREPVAMMQLIERYILDRLSPGEAEELWELFVQHPEWYRYFETELHLRKLAEENSDVQSG